MTPTQRETALRLEGTLRWWRTDKWHDDVDMLLHELLAAYRELPAPYARATLQQRYRAPQPDTYTLDQMHQLLRSEQERCAKICELIEAEAWSIWKTRRDIYDHGRSHGARNCADAIRKQEL